jgi:hypothetical protein
MVVRLELTSNNVGKEILTQLGWDLLENDTCYGG